MNKEQKKKISNTLRGHKVSEETREKIRQKLLGKSYLTEEGRKKIALSSKNRIYNDEAKKNMSIAQKKAFKDGRQSNKGSNNPSWKGGIWNHTSGYIYIHKPELSWSDKRGYVKRANHKWFVRTGEIIKLPYILHHKNGDKMDDRFENLEKTTRKEHIKKHRELINKALRNISSLKKDGCNWFIHKK